MGWSSLKQRFQDEGKTSCEVCGQTSWLTPMHRMKRRHYTKDTLWLYSEVIIACIKCHQKYEFDREGTKKLFEELRGNNEH